jgi:NADPH:quinone reductase-like Zn-dependent oxidoreductase
MKTWELKDAFGLDNLLAEDRPDPEPGPYEVVVSLSAASLNFRDLLVVEGSYSRSITPPLIPLSDGAGTVTAAGSGVSRVAVGDRVMPTFFQGWIGGEPRSHLMAPTTLGGPLDGTLAEAMVISEQGLVKTPDYLSDEEAACLPCAALTAWSALIFQGELGPGDFVLIQGTGGVALFAVQFAKLAGAEVMVVSSSDEKLERARALGADHTHNYSADPDWDKAVKAITGGEGCDHVLELGGSDTLARSLKAVRTGGRISLIGVLSGAIADLNLPLVVMRNVRLQGVTVGSRETFETMVRAMALHDLHPVVDSVIPFAEAPAAFRQITAGGHVGKICVRMGG